MKFFHFSFRSGPLFNKFTSLLRQCIKINIFYNLLNEGRNDMFMATLFYYHGQGQQRNLQFKIALAEFVRHLKFGKMTRCSMGAMEVPVPCFVQVRSGQFKLSLYQTCTQIKTSQVPLNFIFMIFLSIENMIVGNENSRKTRNLFFILMEKNKSPYLLDDARCGKFKKESRSLNA